MYFLALATDYDGTIAVRGIVDETTRAGLQRLKHSGRRLIMVTGRELSDLKRVCSDLSLFDIVVAENGAVLYRPDSDGERVLAPPPARFVERLREAGVTPLSVDPSQWAFLKARLELIIDASSDSLRYYYLGPDWVRRIEHVGAKPATDLGGPLIV